MGDDAGEAARIERSAKRFGRRRAVTVLGTVEAPVGTKAQTPQPRLATDTPGGRTASLHGNLDEEVMRAPSQGPSAQLAFFVWLTRRSSTAAPRVSPYRGAISLTFGFVAQRRT